MYTLECERNIISINTAGSGQHEPPPYTTLVLEVGGTSTWLPAKLAA